MKPIKLTMYGFMTYKEKVEIDFRKLYQSRIFVISGDTGSGKTSIFDAISFALFGDISRPDVDQINLRSDFLTESDAPTFVNFVFDIDGKVYEIERKPIQYAKKKIKAGVKINHDVAFYEIKGESKKLLSDKVGESNNLIKEILGLDQAQLKKVMLLAQGQFSEFLSADSSTKADLLSNIFQTGEYGRITEEIKEMSKTFGDDLENLENKLEEVLKRHAYLDSSIDETIRLKHDFAKIIESTNKFIVKKDKYIIDLKERIEKDNKTKDKLIDQLSKAKSENENIILYNKISGQKAIFDEKLEVFESLKESLKKAKNANSIRAYYERLDQIKMAKEKISLSISEKEKAKEIFEKKYENLRIEKDAIKTIEEEIDRLKIQMNGLKEKKESFEKFIRIKNQYQVDSKYKEELKDLESGLENLKNKDRELSDNILEKSNYLLTIKDKTSQNFQAKTKFENDLALNKDLNKNVEKNLDLQEKIDSLKEKAIYLEEKIKEAKNDFELALINQENIEKAKYIKQLNETGICPICGSIHEETIEEKEIFDFDLDELRNKYQNLKNQKEFGQKEISIYEKSLLSDLPSLEEVQKNRKQIEEELSKVSISLEENNKEINNLQNHIEKLQIEKSMILKENENLQAKISKLKEKLLDFDDLERTYLSMKDSLEDMDGQVIDEKIKVIAKELGARLEKVEQINKEFVYTDKKLAELRSFLSTSRDNLISYEKSYIEIKEIFDKKIKEYFSSMDEFIERLDTYEDLQKQEENIEKFFDDYKAIKVRLDALKLYKDKEVLDLEIYEKDITDLTEKINILRESLTKENIDLSNLEFILGQVKDIEVAYKEKASDGQILSRLSKIASGKDGAVIGREKLDFETFVLIYYFEKILAYSNKRLYKMSNGQYRMVRKTSGGDMRSKQGLDIEIIDSNTGKTRPASTLSGGETFLASLSLALGLSDEISAENGGIKIDTLFIDEGFGSLSENYLQNAIATIEKLSYENKFIGLISHVKEVKDAIDAKILVKYDKSKGSEVEIII